MRLALIQLNPTVGDVRANADLILSWTDKARRAGADLIVFPELALTAYPPRDLLTQHGFLEAITRTAHELAPRLTPPTSSSDTNSPTVILGSPWRADSFPPSPSGRGQGEGFSSSTSSLRSSSGGMATALSGHDSSRTPQAALPHNALLVFQSGRLAHIYAKRLLPTYDVFDEDRYFTPGDRPLVITVAGVRIGLSLCEDLWRGEDAGVSTRYAGCPDPVADLIAQGAQLIINPSGSPFVLGKGARQRALLTQHVRAHRVAVAAVNQVGGNDDLIFDGHAAVFVPDSTGQARLIAAAAGFREEMLLTDLDPASWSQLSAIADPLLTAPSERLLWNALVLGTRDYCRKTNFTRAVIGLSGGIDSALTAAVACAAIGASNVLGLIMPSRFSSPGSITDAADLAQRLGMQTLRIPITEPHDTFEQLLRPRFAELGLPAEPGLTEENIQSRIRGLILMAFSNKMNSLLVTTGNKSEFAVGYTTLYGDMNGGLAVLSDVTKTRVYELANWLNANWRDAATDASKITGLKPPFTRAPIPSDSISKPPSAELRANQKDSDSLPSYDILDAVIERYIVTGETPAEIHAATNIDAAIVERIIRMIHAAEYKRKQMPVGLKVSEVTFGPGRRWPIVHKWKP
ncbi:MAG TPA: NAD+ synthase [Phycisphaerales bacterium]|nr:NAD+ synthase [Phycisphaerales bacterium]